MLDVHDDVIDLQNPVSSVDSYSDPSTSSGSASDDGFNPSPQIPLSPGGGASVSHLAVDVGVRDSSLGRGLNNIFQVQPKPFINQFTQIPAPAFKPVQGNSVINQFESVNLPINGIGSPADVPKTNGFAPVGGTGTR